MIRIRRVTFTQTQTQTQTRIRPEKLELDPNQKLKKIEKFNILNPEKP